GRRLETRIEDQLNTAVKPISKIYELWCLGVLLEFFEEIYQTSPDAGQIAGTYTITPDVTLLYNSSVYRYSNYLTSAFEVGAGRPDFALVVDDKLVWIGDAKSKSWDSLQLSDYQRFLTYILDLLSVDQTGSILYAEKERPAQRQTVRDFEVQHVPLRPGGKQKAMKSLRDLLSPQLPAVPSTPNQS
ncbi:hypothetical protein, partial [Halorubrum sp. BV1]|uniref:hypothetical protein n=1 Tax=Halorubrum sp. BV1 TaxID=1498500 RepID=UPI0018AD0F74